MTKRLFLLAALLTAYAPNILAQEAPDEPDELTPAGAVANADTDDADDQGAPMHKYKVVTNTFWSNWSVGLAAGITTFHPDQSKGSDRSANRTAPALTLQVEKAFTPALALRTTLGGLWGKQVNADATADYHYLLLQEQAVLDITNIFRGYRPERRWHLAAFAGAGFLRNTTESISNFAYSAGLRGSRTLSGKLTAFAEFQHTWADPAADAATNGTGKGTDKLMNIAIGITYNIGPNAWQRATDNEADNMMRQAELDALNAQINDMQAENQRLQQQLDTLQHDEK